MPDGVGLGVEAHERGDGPEDLLAHDLHVGRHVADDGGAVEERAGLVDRATGENLGALLDGVADQRLDLLDRLAVDQRADVRAGLEARSDGELLHGFDEGRRETVVDAGLHENAVGADAGLAGVAVFGGHGAGHRLLEIGVVEDEERRVAAELEGELLHGVGALAVEHLADARSSR